ncbi:class I SAM-dependent methyltransferase [Candidatus Micrarchaeota archaeon]|nr:class I SAM-dependent methyltransferase [Candidatus Micrarchaeota archaeon]
MKHVKCNLCGKDDCEAIFRNEKHELNLGDEIFSREVVNVICKNCGLIYNNPQMEQDELAYMYAKMTRELEFDPGTAPKKEKLDQKSLEANQYDFIMRNVSNTEKLSVLDIGCSLGKFLRFFKENGHGVMGIEPSKYDSKYARSVFGLDVINSIFKKELVEARKFDIVAMNYVFEHIDNPMKMLANIRDMLTDEGYVYIEVPNSENPFMGFCDYFSIGHLYSFTPTTITSILRAAGFEEIAVQTDNDSPEDSEKTFPYIRILAKKSNVAKDILSDYQKSKAKFELYKKTRDELIEKTKIRFSELRNGWQQKDSKVMVWGAGTHSSEMIKNRVLKETDLYGFIDSNPHFQGKMFYGKQIYAPAEIEKIAPDCIVLSSQFSENSIYMSAKRYEENGTAIIKVYDQ